jgi:uncharacterized protein YbjT (DUF2867 family)
MERNLTLILVGATGLVGSHVLGLALDNPHVGRIIAPTRRPLPAHNKLHAPLVDYENLQIQCDLWRADAVICTLGTTIGIAGSPEAFHHVDYDYPLLVANVAHAAGTPVYVLNSATGAHVNSRFFYNRVKGELERDMAHVGFKSLTFVRPGLIDGHRNEFRLGERFLAGTLKLIGWLLPKGWRLNPAPKIAQALLDAALSPQPGIHIVKSDQLI